MTILETVSAWHANQAVQDDSNCRVLNREVFRTRGEKSITWHPSVGDAASVADSCSIQQSRLIGAASTASMIVPTSASPIHGNRGGAQIDILVVSRVGTTGVVRSSCAAMQDAIKSCPAINNLLQIFTIGKAV